MNIDDYRAMVKAEAESKKDQPAEVKDEPVTPASTIPEVTTPDVPEVKEEATPVVTKTKITIDGLGEVDLEDVKEWQKGYLRTSDYTKKTQDVAAQRKENEQAIELFNYLRQNPHLAQVLIEAEKNPNAQHVTRTVDPTLSKVDLLEQQIYDLKLQREIDDLKGKYSDFDVVEVLTRAEKEKITNLETAYKLTVADKPTKPAEPVDVEALKKQIKAELQRELEAEANTTSLISTNDGTATNQDEPTLTPEEDTVRKKLRLSKEEYIKWRS